MEERREREKVGVVPESSPENCSTHTLLCDSSQSLSRRGGVYVQPHLDSDPRQMYSHCTK